jgi:hypothetical protein
MAKQTTSAQTVDPFVNLAPAPESYTDLIGAKLSELHELIVRAYTPESGDVGEAIKTIAKARPTFTHNLTSALDTTVVARKVYEKGQEVRKAAQDASDRLLVMLASEPQQAPARKRNATIAALSEEEREGLTIASTVNVPLASVQAKFPGVQNTHFLPRMKELGFEVFEKANNGGWYVRVPFNPTAIEAPCEEAPASQDLAKSA